MQDLGPGADVRGAGAAAALDAGDLERRPAQGGAHLTPHGRTILATLAALHRRELLRLGPVFKRFFADISRR